MRFSINSIKSLLGEVAQKAGVTLEYSNFCVISDYINSFRNNGEIYIKEDYLYKNIYRTIVNEEKKNNHSLTLNQGYVNRISRCLGYKSFEHYLEIKSQPLNPILKSCTGSWYSFVRRNIKKAEIIRSPVRIYIHDHKVKMQLSGPINEFHGNLNIAGGCIYCLFRAENGKEFHHVYKIGLRTTPKLLQGIFSGASTGGEPIGGRVILMKQNEPFEKLTLEKIPLHEDNCFRNEEHKKLKVYFSRFDKNNLRINRTETFDLEDLMYN